MQFTKIVKDLLPASFFEKPVIKGHPDSAEGREGKEI